MSLHPFDSGELGRTDPEMDRIGSQLERYASEVGDEPPVDLAARISAILDDEPIPAVGWWASLGVIVANWQGPARLVMVAAVLAIGFLGAVALTELADWARDNSGGPPGPSEIIAPTPILRVSPTPTPTQTPAPTPSQTTTPTPTPTPSPSASGTADPSASDDDRVETPEPSESDDDNSGPGGGDNSGPGGGRGND